MEWEARNFFFKLISPVSSDGIFCHLITNWTDIISCFRRLISSKHKVARNKNETGWLNISANTSERSQYIQSKESNISEKFQLHHFIHCSLPFIPYMIFSMKGLLFLKIDHTQIFLLTIYYAVKSFFRKLYIWYLICFHFNHCMSTFYKYVRFQNPCSF